MVCTRRQRGDGYSSREFWESRYKGGYQHSWYYEWQHLAALMSCYISNSTADVLEIGCGDSPIIYEMRNDICGSLVAIDYSKALIEQLRVWDAAYAGSYLEMDARRLRFDAQSFDIVFDKGTIDAMLCDVRMGMNNARGIISEACRVLKPDGSIVIVSHMAAESDEFMSVMQEAILPTLDKHRSVLWRIDAHTHSTSNVDNGPAEITSATVFVLRSKPRRFTRSCLSPASTPVPLQILLHTG